MGLFDRFKGKNTVEEKQTEQNASSAPSIPFTAYKGKEPYVFISYAHVDSIVVYPIISEFHSNHYNVWYDEGIEPGIEWPEEIAKALDGCALFLVFITPSSVSSPNVRNEINFALAKKLPFIAIHLQETELTPGLQLQIGSKQAILKYNMEHESFKRKYTYSFETVLRAPGRRITPPLQAAVEAPASVYKPTVAIEPSPLNLQKDNPTEPIIAKKDIMMDCEWIGNKMIRYRGGEKEFTIPFRASTLFSNAFKDNPTIEKIIIPSHVSMIDFEAFDNCSNLSLVIIEGGYVKMGNGNLDIATRCDKIAYQCHRNSLTHRELEKVVSGPISFFPGEDFEIEHGVLNKYYGDAREVHLPNEVQLIGGFSFQRCLNLESLVLNDECGGILDDAFIYCPQLKNITLGKSFNSLAKGALKHNPYVTYTYYKDRMPMKLEQIFPDMSIVSEIEQK